MVCPSCGARIAAASSRCPHCTASLESPPVAPVYRASCREWTPVSQNPAAHREPLTQTVPRLRTIRRVHQIRRRGTARARRRRRSFRRRRWRDLLPRSGERGSNVVHSAVRRWGDLYPPPEKDALTSFDSAVRRGRPPTAPGERGLTSFVPPRGDEDTHRGSRKRGRQATRPAGPLEAGQSFGHRYHIIRPRRRRDGRCVSGVDAELGVTVAIKVIRPDVMADPTAAAEIERRFKRELLLARQVTHRTSFAFTILATSTASEHHHAVRRRCGSPPS